MPDLQIIGTPHSNFTWTTRIVCVEKGVAYAHVQLRPHTPEVERISPFGLIPVMRHGDLQVFEARAICTYIDRAFSGPSLIPSDPVKAALTEQWVSAVTTSVDRLLMRQYVLKHATPGTPDGKPDRAAIDAALTLMPKQLSMLDRAVGTTGYLAGDAFTLADAYLVPILFFMTKLQKVRRCWPTWRTCGSTSSTISVGRASGIRPHHLIMPRALPTTPDGIAKR